MLFVEHHRIALSSKGAGLRARVTKREFPDSSKQEACTSQSPANRIQGFLEARGAYLPESGTLEARGVLLAESGHLETRGVLLAESGNLEARGVVLAESGNLEARGVLLAEPPYDR